MFNKLKLKIDDFMSPVLSDRTIIEYNSKGLLIEGILDKEQIQPNSVDLTLRPTFKKISYNVKPENGNKKYIDISKEIEYKAGTFDPIDTNRPINRVMIEHDPTLGQYILKPGEFVLMASNEVINIPNGIIGFVQGRSSIARLGIQTEQAGLIDAGFRGTITFEVFNQTKYPIILRGGMRIAQVYFFKAQKAKNIYGSTSKNSKYFGQIDPTGSMINEDFRHETFK